MREFLKNKSVQLNTLLCIIALLVTIVLVAVNSYIQEGFDISAGDVSPRTFVATRQIENRVATERLRNDARESVLPHFMLLTDVEPRVIEKLDGFFETIYNLRVLNEPPEPMPILDSHNELVDNDDNYEPFLENSYSQEYQIDETEPIFILPLTDETRVILQMMTRDQIEYLVFLEQNELTLFRINLYHIAHTLLESRIQIEDHLGWEAPIKGAIEAFSNSLLLPTVGFLVLDEFLEPNYVLDIEGMENLKDSRVAEVEPIIFLQNQNIVTEGEIVTEEILQVLYDLGYLNVGFNINLIPILGAVIIIALVFIVAIVYMYLQRAFLKRNPKFSFLVFALYIIVVAVPVIPVDMNYLFVPILIFTMLIGLLLGYRLAILLNALVTIMAFLVFDGDLGFLLYFLIAGTSAAILTTYSMERNKIMITSLLISLASASVAVGVSILLNRTIDIGTGITALYGFGVGFFAVIICVGTLPIWETLFGMVTPLKLQELTNPSNELLKRLSIEAPGTYHHSIIVANLAEAAAYDIKADTTLSRVGAYFHDIGKLRHPQLFIENQMGGINLHDEIYPLHSLEIIKDHMEYSIQLAEKHKLPIILRDVIQQHHGTTLVKYFYEKAKKLEGPESVKEEDFRYNGPIPQSKEAAIIMLADTVEAAIRAMMSSSGNSTDIDVSVDKLVKGKLDDDQLLDSSLTLKDLDTIKKAFVRILKGMYHDRVSYPKEQKL